MTTVVDDPAPEPTLTEIFDESGSFIGYATRDIRAAKRRPSKRFTDPYVVMFLPELERLAADQRVRVHHYRVLLQVLVMAERDGRTWPVDLHRIAEITNVAYTRVSSSISDLVAWGYLQRARKGVLKMEPKVAWKGEAKNREQAIENEVAEND